MGRPHFVMNRGNARFGETDMPTGAFIYFAYGSNMLTARLRKRCQSAQSLGTAIAHGVYLRFWKPSKDGSGKATLIPATEAGNKVYGVLFEIDTNERKLLDRSEGGGYKRDDTFSVTRTNDCKQIAATAYVASENRCRKDLMPYDWYLDLVVAGAIQHGLPDRYVEELRGIAVRTDRKLHRRTRLEAREVLKSSGFLALLESS